MALSEFTDVKSCNSAGVLSLFSSVHASTGDLRILAFVSHIITKNEKNTVILAD